MEKMEKVMENGAAAETVSRAEYEALQKQHEAEIYALKVQYAVEGLLSSAGAKNPGFLKKLIPCDTVPAKEDGSPDTSAISAAIAALRETDGYLFSEEKPTAVGKEAGNPGGATGMRYDAPATEDAARMSDAAYYRSLRLRRGK